MTDSPDQWAFAGFSTGESLACFASTARRNPGEMSGEFDVGVRDIQLRRELIALGWTDRAIAREVRSGRLAKVRYGAYVHSAIADGLDEAGHMRLRNRAVLRTVGVTSVLSHQSALAEYGVPLWGLETDAVHVTRIDRRAGRREAGVAQHRGQLDESQVYTINGLPVVSAARAAVEVILSTDREVGLVALCSVLHSGCATLEEVRHVAEQVDRWPNSLHARLVLDRADPRISSIGEGRSWHLFFEHRIPRPELQVEVLDDNGLLIGIVDFLWRDPGVFMEFDGRVKYAVHRRPGETLEQYLMREKRREEAICAATGWVCIRITWADLSRPVTTARRISRLLESRRDRLP